MKPKKNFVYLSVFILFITSHVNSGTFAEKKFDFGIAPGVLFSGDIYISLYGEKVNQNSSFLIRTYADAFVIPQISFGLYFNYTTLNLAKDIDIFGEKIERTGTPIWEIGASIKPRFILSEKFALKPGFNIGHRQFAGENDFTTWQGLALNASCELQYSLPGQVNIFAETGFLYQPYGGNEDTDITFDPIFYLVFGIVL